MTPEDKALLQSVARKYLEAGDTKKAAQLQLQIEQATERQARESGYVPIPAPSGPEYSPQEQFLEAASRSTGSMLASAGQGAATVGERLGLLAPGTAQSIQEAERGREEHARNVLGDSFWSGSVFDKTSGEAEVGRIFGQVAPTWFMGGGTGLAGRAAIDAGIGGVLGFLEFAETPQERQAAAMRSAFGGAAGSLGLGLLSKAGHSALGTGLVGDVADRARLSSEYRVPMTTGELLDSRYMTGQEGASRMAFGGKPAAIREAQEESFEEFRNSLLGTSAVDPTVSRTRQAVADAIDMFEDEANAKYAPLNAAFKARKGEAAPDMDIIWDEARKYIDEVDASLDTPNPRDKGPAYAIAEKLENSLASDLSGLRNIRKNMIDPELYGRQSTLTNAQKADLGRLRRSVTKAMENEAKEVGMLPEFKEAESWYGSTIKPLQEALGSAGGGDARLLAQRLLSRPAELKNVYSTLGEGGKAEVKEELFGYVRDKALTPDGEFSYSKFRSLLGDPSKSAGIKQLLSPDELAEFRGRAKIAAYLNKAERQGRNVGTGQTATIMGANVAADALAGGIAGQVLTGDWTTGAAAGAAAGVLGPQLWNSPLMKRFLIRANRTAPSGKGMARLVADIENAIARATASTAVGAGEPSESPAVLR